MNYRPSPDFVAFVILSLVLLGLMGMATASHAGMSVTKTPKYRWTRDARLADLNPTIVTVIVNSKQMRELERHHLKTYARDTRGLSVLKRAGGKWTCYIYLRSAKDKTTRTHELMHCAGWAHK